MRKFDVVQGDGLKNVAGRFDLIVGSPPLFESPEDPALAASGIGETALLDLSIYVQRAGRLYVELFDRLHEIALTEDETEVCIFGVNMAYRFPTLVRASCLDEERITNLTIERVIRNIDSVYFVLLPEVVETELN
eukprot:CAMPEP_0119314890 /NCGR_PEP_ID=MMETSP1333-20130426/34086_1 /TAXON_ID=418940 /ORGANISM="Scyphosphaera apsteinii, Strain RCC1455" /LENGTH=134 /DNA_ID=CAMNT_0007320089 /DNA_START=354 /DNA_END=758 /DNA_ORIENTATION=-